MQYVVIRGIHSEALKGNVDYVARSSETAKMWGFQQHALRSIGAYNIKLSSNTCHLVTRSDINYQSVHSIGKCVYNMPS